MMTALICKCTIFLVLVVEAFSVPLPESQIYLHTDMFKDNYCNVTPKDVGAFKFFCIQDYTSSIVNQHIDTFADIDPFTIQNHFKSATRICKEYAGIKTYQTMLHHLLGQKGTVDVSNATILSIVYLLQKAGESLQEIQYDNHKLYCPNYDEDIRMLRESQTYTLESVFRTLYEINENIWSQDKKYLELFNSSRHIQYRKGGKPLCQHFLSQFATMIRAIH